MQWRRHNDWIIHCEHQLQIHRVEGNGVQYLNFGNDLLWDVQCGAQHALDGIFNEPENNGLGRSNPFIHLVLLLYHHLNVLFHLVSKGLL